MVDISLPYLILATRFVLTPYGSIHLPTPQPAQDHIPFDNYTRVKPSGAS